MTKKELNPTEIKAYHSLLSQLEDPFLDCKNKEQLELTIQRQLANIKEYNELSPNCKKFVSDILTSQTDKDDVNKATNFIINEIRKERKKYDQKYFDSLFNGELDSFENFEQATDFFETLQENDPSYYDEAISKLLKSFKNLPKVLNLKHNYGKQYKANHQQLEYIKEAHSTLNKIIISQETEPSLSLEMVQTTPKDYCLRHMDRMLFNGFISANKYIPSNVSKLSAKESIKLLEETPRYKNNSNAQTIIAILKKTMQQYNNTIKTYPELIKKVCYTYIKYIGKEHDLDTFKINFILTNNKNETNKKNKCNYKLLECFNLNDQYLTLEQGYRDKHIEKIEKSPYYVGEICYAVERHLLTFCENNNIDPKIVYAGFSAIKYETNKDGSLEEKLCSHREIYDWLKNLKNKTSDKIFSISLHHDKKRIDFSNSPNEDSENFILTTTISKEILLKFVENIRKFHGSNLNTEELEKSINQIKNIMSQTDTSNNANNPDNQANKEIPDIHSQIFHACDLEIISNNQSYNFFITPKTEENTSVVAAISPTEIIKKENSTQILHSLPKAPKDLTHLEKKHIQEFAQKGR